MPSFLNCQKQTEQNKTNFTHFSSFFPIFVILSWLTRFISRNQNLPEPWDDPVDLTGVQTPRIPNTSGCVGSKDAHDAGWGLIPAHLWDMPDAVPSSDDRLGLWRPLGGDGGCGGSPGFQLHDTQSRLHSESRVSVLLMRSPSPSSSQQIRRFPRKYPQMAVKTWKHYSKVVSDSPC